tara:strand:- start:3350 stop:3961 length:612 start_codon:yes stop_codon:yes gene_type:complete
MIDIKEFIKYFENTVDSSMDVKLKVRNDNKLKSSLANLGSDLTEAIKNGNRVIFAGNGGSAADSQHLAAEFVSRFEFDRPGLPALALSTDTSMITAIGNDYGYENLFLRQLQAQAKPGDIFIGITTSGSSPNIINALNECTSLGVISAVLTGSKDVPVKNINHIIAVPSTNTARIQESHILIGHVLCGLVENEMFGHLKVKQS